MDSAAKGLLFVSDKAKQRGLGSDDEEGYRGAELKNVELSNVHESTRTNIILEKLGNIFD